MATTMLLVRKSMFLFFLIASCKGRSSNAKELSFDGSAYFDYDQQNPFERRSMMDDLPGHIVDVGADSLWAQDIQGAGIVVGVASSGVNIQHEALSDNYLGRKADGTLDHTYSWLEAVPVSPLGYPYDFENIGTHLTSTIVGNKNNIGIAPKAKYIHCQYVFFEWGFAAPPEIFLQCLDWFLQPGLDTAGDQFNVSLSVVPDIVVMPECWECSEAYVLKEATDALFEAGVLIVSSGQSLLTNGCAGLRYPPGIYDNVLTVAALDTNGSLYNQSALGPVLLADGTVIDSYIKPDGSAYGRSVNGAVYLEGKSQYLPASGASVAAAVVAGSVALLLEALPCLRRQPGKVIELLHKSMEPIESTDCFSSQAYPNNVYGYGKINVPRTIETFLTLKDFKDDRKRCGTKGKNKGKKKGKKGKKKSGKKETKSDEEGENGGV